MYPRPITIITMTLLSILVVACASKEDKKAKPDPTAFEWAMDQDIRFNTLLDECDKVDSGLVKNTITLRKQWQKHYWNAISAANYHYNQKQATKNYIYNNEQISLPATKFMFEHKNAALKEIYYQKRLPEKQAEYCRFRMAAYEKKEDGMGTLANENKLRYLKELSAKTPTMSPRSVPSLAGSLQPNSPGPALYEIEQQASEKRCSAPQILTFYNQGHNELYGVYCSGSAGYFVGCEWSQCHILEK
ncbi:MAG TPA: hypothetical protein VLB90_06830 [Pseudomonadales bacterium]|nr:hypothetical protein [Pseudomonadales bacterium]